MFQTAELGQKVSRSEFRQRELILLEMRREVQEKVNESATDGKGSQVKTVMDKLDLSLSLGKKKYRQELEVCQAMQKKPSTILVFEGPDAAG